jgi:uncharacterized protein (DUF2267 family)
MRHEEFIGQVRIRACLGSRDAAERACRATLETLGERIPASLAYDLGTYLPQEIAVHLRPTGTFGELAACERLDKDTFTDRVATRAGVSPARAACLARVVLEVVAEAAHGKEMGKLRASVPRDIRLLIDAGSGKEVSA